MIILSVSAIDLWPWGKNKGIPSIYASQKGFVERGHQVHFLCQLQWEDLSLKEDYEGISIYRFKLPFNISSSHVGSFPLDNIRSHIRSSLIFNLEWFLFQIYSIIWGVKLARLVKPDIIYAHGLNSALPAFILSRLFGAKLVIRVYGVRELYFKWKDFLFRLKEFRDYLCFKIPADYFIFTDDGTQGNLLALKLGVPVKKIKIWRNGVDLSMYEPNPGLRKEFFKELKIESYSKMIISTCRVIDVYGVDRLVYALPEVFKKNKDSVCLIVGDGPEKQKLREFIRQEGIQSRVLFLDSVERGRLKQLLNAADIFVLLSRYHNCTNTMWEAMVCGKCIVTVENDSIKEALTSSVNAVFLPPGDLKGLAEVLIRLLDNDKLRNELGNNAHSRAQDILKPWNQRIGEEAELLEKLTAEELFDALPKDIIS